MLLNAEISIFFHEDDQKEISRPKNNQDLLNTVKNLQQNLLHVNEELQQQQENFKKEQVKHMEKLHVYNDLKDTGQMLLGALATLEGRTTKQMYSDFGLEQDD